MWAEDGIVYDAVVDVVDHDAGTADITYTEYGNSDTVSISALMPARNQRQPPVVDFDRSEERGGPMSPMTRLGYPPDNARGPGGGSAGQYAAPPGRFGQMYPEARPSPGSTAVPPTRYDAGPAEYHNPYQRPNYDFPSSPSWSRGRQGHPVNQNGGGDVPTGDDEPLASMLMAWYQSGFHTGYYQALQEIRREQQQQQQQYRYPPQHPPW